MYNPFSLEDKTILVTGASSGIGRATAVECARMGATVVLTARDEERLNETLALLQGEERPHLVIPADLTKEQDVAALLENMPRLDGCVSNAGMGMTLPLQFASLEKMEQLYRVNCFAPVLLVKELIKKKKLTKGASVVFTSSIAGLDTFTFAELPFADISSTLPTNPFSNASQAGM